MDARQYLSQLKRLRSVIENKRAEIEQWKAVAYGITPQTNGERVQSMGKPDKMATAVCNYATIEAELEKQIDEYGETMLEVISVVEQLEDPFYSIIHKHYIENKKFEQISEEVNYSYQYTTEMHRAALGMVQRIIDKRH
jgi:hypothetical protein